MNIITPRYSYDTDLAPSPVSLDQLVEIEHSLLWGFDDQAALREAGRILVPQTEAILDVWYGFVGANPHLVATFAGKNGEPDGAYLAAVRRRFGLWIKDLCQRDFDDQWLGYQEEIGLRHHPIKKNATDRVESPAGHVPVRHLIALIVPITVTIRGFLEKGETDPAKVEAMYQAWFKAVTLSVVMWTRPYTPELW